MIIANEILPSMRTRKGKRGWFVLKLDLEKAYDKLEWSFIRSSLLRYGLDSNSVCLIMSSISLVSSSVLVNEIPTDYFVPSRGIRQGDPLSPYIFIICMEVLSLMIHEATENLSWIPFSMGRKRVPISHLLFYDDIMLFGEVSVGTTASLRNILDSFCQISGQTISIEKSMMLFSKNTHIGDRYLFCEAVHIQGSNDINPYLGFSLSGSRPTKTSVKFIMNKITGKLSSWKSKFLTKAGRLCLISSTLNTVPNYYMQCLLLPESILKAINSCLAKFLWGKDHDKKGLHLINWGTISKPKEGGGLGIRCVRALNKAYILKMWWCMIHQEDNLAIKILKDKYSKSNNMFRAFSYGSHLWKAMGKVWDLFKANVSWGLGSVSLVNL